MAPDVWGWNGGRVRAIADALADQGYLVVVGKFLATPPKDGGTDGDALAPTASFDPEWVSNFSWPKQKGKVHSAIGYLKEKGCKKIGVMGFCYGGHPACWASAEDADVKCGVVFHPSMQLEEKIFGGSTAELLTKVQCPFLLAPAGNDLPLWAEDGELGAALKASATGSGCVWKPFPEMSHGWSCRGDLSDEKVKRDVDLCMKEAIAYLEKYLK